MICAWAPSTAAEVARFVVVASVSLGAATLAVAFLQDVLNVPNPSSLYLVAVVTTAIASGTWGARHRVDPLVRALQLPVRRAALHAQRRPARRVREPVAAALRRHRRRPARRAPAAARRRGRRPGARGSFAVPGEPRARDEGVDAGRAPGGRLDPSRRHADGPDLDRAGAGAARREGGRRHAGDGPPPTRGRPAGAPADARGRAGPLGPRSPAGRPGRPRSRRTATSFASGSRPVPSRTARSGRCGRGSDRLPDRTETRLLAATADQLGQALRQDRLAAEARAAEVARKSEELKSALLQSVSHDLRTPLATIRAAAGTLQPGTAAQRGRTSARAPTRSTARSST